MKKFLYTEKSTGATEVQDLDWVKLIVGGVSLEDEFGNTDLGLIKWAEQAEAGDVFETEHEKWECK